jgi:hypothetical protein
MGRTVEITLLGVDLLSRSMNSSAKAAKKLQTGLEGLSKVGKAAGIAAAAGQISALGVAAAPAAAAIAALPAALASVQAATMTVKVGIKGVGEAMEAVASGDAKQMEKALKNLTPAAREFVKEATGFKEAFKPVQKAVQESLFKGLGDQMKGVSGGLMPVLQKGMVGVAGALNGVAKEAIKFASSPIFKKGLAEIFKGTAVAINNLKPAVSSILTIFMKLGTAGQPLIARFTKFIAVQAQLAAQFVNSKRGADGIAAAIKKSGDVVAQLGRIVANVATGLFNIFKNGDEGAKGMLDSIERLTQTFSDWAKSTEGQEKSAELFGTLNELAKAITQTLVLVGGSLAVVFGWFEKLPGPVKSVVINVLAFSVVLAPLTAKLLGVFKVVGMLGAGLARLRLFFLAGASGVSPFSAMLAALRAKLIAVRAAIMAKLTALRLWLASMWASIRAGAAFVVQLLRQAAAVALNTARTLAAAAAQRAIAIATRIWAAAIWLVNRAMQMSPIGLIITALVLLGVAVVLMYKKFAWFRNMVNAVWAGIQLAIKWAWENVIRPIWEAIKGYITRTLIPNFKLLLLGVKMTFTMIGTIIRAVWNSVIRPTWEFIKRYITGPLILAFKTYLQIAKQVWNAVGTAIRNVWNVFIKPTFNKISEGLAGVRQAFRTGVDAIKGLWEKLRGILKAPISFFVNTVYTGGVKRVWDGVRKLVPALPGLPSVQFAKGGVFPGYTPGRDVHQVPMAAFSGGEGVLRPEVTRALGEGWIHGINKVATGGPSAVARFVGGYGDAGGVTVQKFKDGGILGGIKDILKKPIDWAKNAGSAILKYGADKFANGILDPIINRIPRGDGGLWGQAAYGIPKSMLTAFKNFIKTTVSPNIGGGGSQAAVNAARSMIGWPYSWGGGDLSGPTYGIGRGAGTKGFDCSGLMEYAWGKASGGKSIGGVTYEQRARMRTIANPVPGAVGQPHAGHTYMYSGNGRIIEAAYTGTNVREVPMRTTPWWGMPPWVVADEGGFLPGNSTTLVSNQSRNPEALIPLDKMMGAGLTVVNQGHIASQADMERWLTTTLERLRRRNKLPGHR